MDNMNIPLPDPTNEFIEAQADREGFGSIGEYLQVQDAVRRFEGLGWMSSQVSQFVHPKVGDGMAAKCR
jgi:hypothetical protein